MSLKIDRSIDTDILVIGAGLAGIKAAYESSKSGLNVLIAVKSRLCSGSSFYPSTRSLGCQATANEEDKEYFLQEINERGMGMNNEALSKIYVENIKDRVKELAEMGIKTRRLSGERKACFAKKPRDIYILENWDEIRNNLYQIFKAKQNVKLMEGLEIIGLIKKSGSIKGAVGALKDGSFVIINAKAVILASGGFGDIYKHSLNTSDTCGSGHILALDAGAKLTNMEFIQFIPGFIKPQYKTILGEQTLLFCKKIKNSKGEDVLKSYLPGDISEEECLRERSTHGPFSTAAISKYFDIAMMKEILKNHDEGGFTLEYSEEIFKDNSEFTKMYVNWLLERGINIVKDTITIAPFSHAGNGGIKIDNFASTDVKGLFAAGEITAGLHGADRLGGNSTGNCLVFGKLAGDNAVEFAINRDLIKITEDEAITFIKDKFDSSYVGKLEPLYVIEKIKEIMWFHGNVVRSQDELLKGLEKVEELRKNYNAFGFIEKGDVETAVKAQHFIELSEILLKVMLTRKESRGSHYREDYPELDDKNYKNRLEVVKKDNNIEYIFAN